MLTRALQAIALLIASNIFMNLAWYGHLKWFPKDNKVATFALSALLLPILVSWLLALPEYCLQVPANRLGSKLFGGPFTTPQLKILQEAITLTVFTVISITILKEKPRANDVLAMLLIMAAVAVSVFGRAAAPTPAHP